MELIIKDFKNIKKIDFNYEQIKEELIKKLAKYRDLIYNDETIKEAKNDRASLNKLKKSINDKKIEVNKNFIKPYAIFENKVKELMELIDKPVLEIDTQIKRFEKKQREKKQKEIEEIFTNLIKDKAVVSLLTLNMIFNEKWLNISFKIKEIEEEISNKIKRISEDLEAIKQLNSDFETELINQYLKHFELGQIITENNRLQELKKATVKVEERKEEIKEETIEKMVKEKVELEEDEPIKTYILKITGTLSQQKKLKEFLDLNNMKYEKVD